MNENLMKVYLSILLEESSSSTGIFSKKYNFNIDNNESSELAKAFWKEKNFNKISSNIDLSTFISKIKGTDIEEFLNRKKNEELKEVQKNTEENKNIENEEEKEEKEEMKENQNVSEPEIKDNEETDQKEGDPNNSSVAIPATN